VDHKTVPEAIIEPELNEPVTAVSH
jgi:hypothetical protein